MAIAKEFQKCDSESGARNRYLVDFNKKNGSLGTKLPLCDKIELKKVFRLTGNFRAYFQDFDIIRDDFVPGAGAIQAAPVDSAEDVDHYAALGLEPGAGKT